MSDAAQEPTHVVFLRAINVGRRRLAMGELVDACRGAGIDVRASWQGTGNLVVAAPDLAADGLAQRVEQALLERLELDAPAVVRTVDEVRAIAAAAPFVKAELASTEHRIQVLLLRDAADEVVRAEVEALVPDEDLIRWVAQELWWLPVQGVSTSDLPVRKVERLTGTSTMRGQRAIAGLVGKHLGS